MIIKNTLNDILLICDTVPDQLRDISNIDFCAKLSSRWSKQEILGHLTDSASVNIQRLLRGQIEYSPQIYYDQDEWVAIQDYQHYNKAHLIALWELLNRHFVYIANRIPEENLKRTCQMRDGQAVTLRYLIEDYLSHLQHHLQQIMTQNK